MHSIRVHNNSPVALLSHIIDDEALVGELNALGVHFLSGGDGRQEPELTPAALLMGLAASADTRVQLALISLFFVRPDYAQDAQFVATQLQGRPYILFCCYYTATVYLQQAYAGKLQAVQLPASPLPNLFSAELQLPLQDDSEQTLRLLATRQQQLLQDSANWFGAYEHAIQRLIRRRQIELQWSR